jgi:acyl-CoA synthetase (NDP forming)
MPRDLTPFFAPKSATMEQAGVPAFNSVEEMAECVGLLARYPAIRTEAAAGGRPRATGSAP